MPIEQKNQSRNLPAINERIRFPQIRVIDSDGSQLGIMTPEEAMRIAEEKELDLVLVSDNKDMPVCRVMDYGKWQYQQAKKVSKPRASVLKELQLRYNIAEHDYQVRVSQAERFLSDGDKVKVTVTLRGRETQHSNIAQSLLERITKELEPIADIQQAPKKEGNKITALLSPKASKKAATSSKKSSTNDERGTTTHPKLEEI